LINKLNFLKNDDSKLLRQMNTIEWNHDEFIVRFTFRIFNKDYPSSNREKVFILDTDIFSLGSIELSEVESLLITFKEKAIVIFEHSITDSLRNIMV
jgi:uncharacterized protein (TIGR04255 family)